MRISDWSSDVCSSDLNGLPNSALAPSTSPASRSALMRVDDAISPSLIMSSTGLASIPKREPACPRTETSPLRRLPKQQSAPVTTPLRSAETRVGQAWVSTSRYRAEPYLYKKNKKQK